MGSEETWKNRSKPTCWKFVLDAIPQIEKRISTCPITIWPPLCPSILSSWLQIQKSGFDSRRYQTFWEVVGLERGPFSLVSTTEKLPERKLSGSDLEIREYGRRNPSRWPRSSLYPQKLQLISPTSGDRSVGIVRLRTETTEFVFYHDVYVSTQNWSQFPCYHLDSGVRLVWSYVIMLWRRIKERGCGSRWR
jgi:hypothetical protein